MGSNTHKSLAWNIKPTKEMWPPSCADQDMDIFLISENNQRAKYQKVALMEMRGRRIFTHHFSTFLILFLPET